MTPADRPPTSRVRVTGPPRRRRTPLARTGDIDAETRLGGIYMRSLIREQLRLAVLVLAALVGTIGLLPLLFHFVPGLGEVHVLGLPLPWLLLGVLVYPLLVALGWSYVRRAERNELNFAEMLDEAAE